MAVITKISIRVKNKERYNIFMVSGRGEEYAFSVDEQVLIKHALKKGLEIDEFTLMEIGYADEVRRAYNFAIHYLSSRMRSEKEVREYLVKKERAGPAIEEAVHKLSEQKYLDDEQFAIAFVRTQVNTTDKGINVIRNEMKEKGISEALISQSLKEYTNEMQVDKAVKLCEKNTQKYRNESKRILKQKLEQLLMRKGYPFDIIAIAFEETDFTNHSDQDMDAIRYQGDKAHRKYANLCGYEYRQKMKQSLFRKGFSMDMIDRFLLEKEEQD